jgi:Methyltransferase domain
MRRPNVVSRRPRKIERRISRLLYWRWFRGKQLSTDWASENFTMWRRVLTPLRDNALRILEVGSWEGRSALFFLNFFRGSTITCIDTFAGGEEHHTHRPWADKLPKIESRFDHNLAPLGSRVEKVKGPSKDRLRWLAEQRRRFDLAYIDGSHTYDDVLADSIGVWHLVDAGGVIIWDDYKYGLHLSPEQRPQTAIDTFLSDHVGSYRQLAAGYQLIIEKIPEA